METTKNAKGSTTNTIDRHYSFCFLKVYITTDSIK